MHGLSTCTRGSNAATICWTSSPHAIGCVMGHVEFPQHSICSGLKKHTWWREDFLLQQSLESSCRFEFYHHMLQTCIQLKLKEGILVDRMHGILFPSTTPKEAHCWCTNPICTDCFSLLFKCHLQWSTATTSAILSK
jgi:hypothetical protein